MKCKKLVSLFLSLLLATALAVPACAAFEDVFADGSADGTRDGSLFLSGETVRSSAAVNGVLLAAGRIVGVNGTGAYVMAAGYEVTLGGTAENDAFLAGYSIGVSGTAQRDVFAAGQSITVNGTVGRDLYAAANTVTITGSVGGDVYVSAENVVIGDGAKIGGRLHCNASALRSVPDGIADNAELYDEPESGDAGVSITVPDDEPGVGSIVLRKALSFAGVLLLAFGYRSRRSLLVFLLVNLVTQGGFALYLAVTVLNHGVSGWSLLFYIPIEIIITAVELLCYRRLLTEKGRGRAVGYAVAANVCSATVGLLLIDPLWRFIVSIS